MKYYIEIAFGEKITEPIRLFYKNMSWDIPVSSWKDGKATISLQIKPEKEEHEREKV